MLFSKSRIIGLICTVATLASAISILFDVADKDSIASLGNFMSPAIWIPLFVLFALHFFAEPVRWTVYSSINAYRNSGEPVLFRHVFACFSITALLSYSLPFKLGLPLRLYLLTTYLKLEAAKVVKLMAVDGVFNLLSWTLVSVVLILFLPDVLAYFTQVLDIELIISLFVAGCIALSWLWWKKRTQIRNLLFSIPARLAIIVIATLVIDVLFYGVRHFMLARVLEVDIPLMAIFVISIIAVFAGILSTLPMGLGAYDASLVALLGIYGVDIELGLIIAFSNRLGMILTSIILGVPSGIALLKNSDQVPANQSRQL